MPAIVRGGAAAKARGYRGTVVAVDWLMWRWLVIGTAGCMAQLDGPLLVVEPPAIELDVDLALPAPQVSAGSVVTIGAISGSTRMTTRGAPSR